MRVSALVPTCVFLSGCLFPSFDDLRDGERRANSETRSDNVENTPSETRSGDAASAADGGASTVDAAAAPVKTVACANESCNVATQHCCSRFGSSAVCLANTDTSCLSGIAGYVVRCDDEADCPAGEVCCFEDSEKGARCRTSCSAAGKVLCIAASGCPTGESCKGIIDPLNGYKAKYCQP